MPQLRGVGPHGYPVHSTQPRRVQIVKHGRHPLLPACTWTRARSVPQNCPYFGRALFQWEKVTFESPAHCCARCHNTESASTIPEWKSTRSPSCAIPGDTTISISWRGRTWQWKTRVLLSLLPSKLHRFPFEWTVTHPFAKVFFL